MVPRENIEKPPRCVACGCELKPFKEVVKTRDYYNWSKVIERKIVVEHTGDGKKPRWGSRGDNVVCSQQCGHTVLLRLLNSVPDLIDLLPPDWRPDLKPLEENQKHVERMKKLEEAKKRAKEYRKNNRWYY